VVFITAIYRIKQDQDGNGEQIKVRIHVRWERRLAREDWTYNGRPTLTLVSNAHVRATFMWEMQQVTRQEYFKLVSFVHSIHPG
jgi:hypothetical protein